MALEAIGFALGVIPELRHQISSLKRRFENFVQGPELFQDLKTQLGAMDNDTSTVESILTTYPEAIPTETSAMFRARLTSVKHCLARADGVMTRLGQTTFEGGKSGKLKTFVRNFRRVARANAKVEQMEALKTHIKEASDTLRSVVDVLSVCIKVDPNPKPKYTAEFNTPWLLSEIALDFDAKDADGVPVTPEGLLKRAVLIGTEVTAAAGVMHKAYGVVGMAGVGKTIALQGLAHDKDIRKRFVDGVLYISLGQGATVRSVMDGIAKIMSITGAIDADSTIEKCSLLSDAVDHAVKWFKDRICLFLVDDVWPTDSCGTGYLGELRQVLRSCHQSRMAISTRSIAIARSAGRIVDFDARDPHGAVSCKLFMMYATGSPPRESPSGQVQELRTSVYKILSLCAGLPIALSIAGSGVAHLVRLHGDFESACDAYAAEFENSNNAFADKKSPEGSSLSACIQLSLKYLQVEFSKWKIENTSNTKHSIIDLYMSLCVLANQAWVPLSVLSRMWQLDETTTSEVVNMFCGMSLAKIDFRNRTSRSTGDAGLMIHDLHLDFCRREAGKQNMQYEWHRRLLEGYLEIDGNISKLADMLVLRRWNATPGGKVEALSLHDLVLEEAKILSMENNRTSVWHARFLERYMRKAGGNVVESNRYNCREWWDCEKVPEDGYIEKNLARHLAMSKGCELEWLLSDVRWSMRRMKVGGIVGLRNDFQELWDGSGRVIGAEAVLSAVEESWVNMNKSIHAIPFEMYGRLQSQRASSEFVHRFLSSVSMHVPKPHYVPKHEVRWRKDAGQLFRIDFEEEEVAAVCLSEEGNIIAAAQGEEIHVFDLQAMCTVQTLKGHDGRISSVAMNADGSRIVSGSWDGTVRVWDGESGECVVGPLRGHGEAVRCVAMNGDGSRIVSGSRDETVRVWDGESGECVVGPLRGHEAGVWCVAMNGDGSRIVSGSWDKTVRVWNGESGECVVGPLRGHEAGVRCVAMNGDGSRIVSGSWDRTVRVWDGESGECVVGPLRGHEHYVRCVAMNGDGSRIVSGSWDGTVRVWDGESGECVMGPLRGHEDGVSCVAMNGDGSRIVSGSEDKTVRVWDGESGECVVGPLHGHEDYVWCVAMNGDGSRIVSGSWDGIVRVWDGESGECVVGPLRGHEDVVWCVAMNGDGSRIVSGSWDRTVRVWDGESGECVVGPLHGHEAGVPCVAMNGDGSRIVSGSEDRTVRVWDGESGECVVGPLRGHEAGVWCVAMNGDGSRIVSGSGDETVRVWDGESGECVPGNHGGVRFAGRIRSLEFDTGSDLCVVHTSDEVFLLDAATGTKMEHPGYTIHESNGKIYATGPNAKTVQVATMPFECVTFCYNKLHSIAAAGLSDGQVVIGEVLF